MVRCARRAWTAENALQSLEAVEVSGCAIGPSAAANGGSGKQKVLIGEDVAERLDVIPARFRVIVTRRPKYAFKGWDGVI